MEIPPTHSTPVTCVSPEFVELAAGWWSYKTQFKNIVPVLGSFRLHYIMYFEIIETLSTLQSTVLKCSIARLPLNCIANIITLFQTSSHETLKLSQKVYVFPLTSSALVVPHAFLILCRHQELQKFKLYLR